MEGKTTGRDKMLFSAVMLGVAGLMAGWWVILAGWELPQIHNIEIIKEVQYPVSGYRSHLIKDLDSGLCYYYHGNAYQRDARLEKTACPQ